MGTAGCAQQTSAAYSPLRRRGAYYPLFRSAGIHLLIKMLRVYQLCKTTASSNTPLPSPRERPGGVAGPRRAAVPAPASAAVRGAARAALRRYDCPDPAIEMWEPRRRAPSLPRQPSNEPEP